MKNMLKRPKQLERQDTSSAIRWRLTRKNRTRVIEADVVLTEEPSWRSEREVTTPTATETIARMPICAAMR